ncbi:hypothetical protein [uncultured Shewanella sp.]|uniref:hypothetical protein n=1 Tax=uncultured Shewanella sp. TaxID=173975 RepID=UPI00262179E7|nr:hypothetical protein [uncultured Shewanella sp.]
MKKCAVAGLVALGALLSFSAVAKDLSSTIERVWMKGDGKLWLKMTSDEFDAYCKPGWYGFNLYIPDSDPAYPYYYGLITSALAKQQSLFIANIDKFDGTESCDLTETAYGIVVQKA